MAKLDPVVGKDLADEPPTMAVSRLCLAAHQRYSMLAATLDETPDGCLERCLLGHTIVEGAPLLVVMILMCWSAAQFVSHEEIVRTAPAQSRLEMLAIELLSEARVGIGPHVHDELDRLTAHEIDKLLERVVGMTDSPDGWLRTHDHRLPSLTDSLRVGLRAQRAQRAQRGQGRTAAAHAVHATAGRRTRGAQVDAREGRAVRAQTG